MVYFADMFLICFGSSSTFSTVPLVANHPTISFWALSQVVLAACKDARPREDFFCTIVVSIASSLSSQAWDVVTKRRSFWHCHIVSLGGRNNRAISDVPLRCISSSLFQTMPIFLHAQIAGNKTPLRVYHCIFHSELQVLFPLYIFQKRNCCIKSWHVEMRNYYLTKKEISEFFDPGVSQFWFLRKPNLQLFKTNASASRFRLPDSPMPFARACERWNETEERSEDVGWKKRKSV